MVRTGDPQHNVARGKPPPHGSLSDVCEIGYKPLPAMVASTLSEITLFPPYRVGRSMDVAARNLNASSLFAHPPVFTLNLQRLARVRHLFIRTTAGVRPGIQRQLDGVGSRR